MSIGTCDKCGKSIRHAYPFGGKNYGSTCIKRVLRAAGFKACKHYGYLYNDLPTLQNYVELYGKRSKTSDDRRQIKALRGLIGGRAAKAALASTFNHVGFCRDDIQSWEVYVIMGGKGAGTPEFYRNLLSVVSGMGLEPNTLNGAIVAQRMREGKK